MESQSQQIILPCTYSHQPFLVAIRAKLYLFFCYAFNSIQALYGDSVYSYTAWKLAYSEWDNLKVNTLNTGFAPDEIECCPVLTDLGDQLLLTFVGGVKDNEGTIRYHLYVMQGSDLNNLGSPKKLNEEFTFCGFQNNKYQIRNWREPETEILDLDKGGLTTIHFNAFETIQRIVPVPEQEDLILVTGNQEGLPHTFLYKIGDHTPIKEILVDNKPIYKSCIWRDKLVYAIATGDDFEQRQLFFSNYELPFR